MARQTHTREDLLKDATALVPRVQLRLASNTEVFAGFRGEAMSVYFGEDPVYHFNSTNELRRAFIEDSLLEAKGGQLVRLQRQPKTAAMKLLRVELLPGEVQRCLEQATGRIEHLVQCLALDDYAIVGQVPAECNAVAQVAERLSHVLPLRIAAQPRVSK